jgi:hypothetical protein
MVLLVIMYIKTKHMKWMGSRNTFRMNKDLYKSYVKCVQYDVKHNLVLGGRTVY